jgi:predicted transcriptional regulator of viral defense system
MRCEVQGPRDLNAISDRWRSVRTVDPTGFMGEHGSIRRGDVTSLCGLSPQQATRLVKRLTEQGSLEPRGQGKETVYGRGQNL